MAIISLCSFPLRLGFFASRRWTAKNAEVIVKRATYSAWISKDGEELATFSKLVRENSFGLENEIQIRTYEHVIQILINAYFFRYVQVEPLLQQPMSYEL